MSQNIITNNAISSIEIRITDDEDRLINTNNIHFTLTLKFDTIWNPSVSRGKDIKGKTDKVWFNHKNEKLFSIDEHRKNNLERKGIKKLKNKREQNIKKKIMVDNKDNEE